MNENKFRAKVRRYRELERAMNRDFSEPVAAVTRLFLEQAPKDESGQPVLSVLKAAQQELNYQQYAGRVAVVNTPTGWTAVSHEFNDPTPVVHSELPSG